MRIMGLLAVVSFLAGCGTSQTAPADLSPGADSGTIILRLAAMHVVPTKLMLAPYDPNNHRLGGGSYAGIDMFRVSDRGFVWKRIRPGTYVLHSYIQQDTWDLCFYADTEYFTLSPGQTLYLGTFDPAPYDSALTQDVQYADDTKLPHRTVRSYYDSPTAHIEPDRGFPDTGGTLPVSATQSVQASKAVLAPASFALGTDVFGTGGLFHLGGKTCFGAAPGMDVKYAQ